MKPPSLRLAAARIRKDLETGAKALDRTSDRTLLRLYCCPPRRSGRRVYGTAHKSRH